MRKRVSIRSTSGQALVEFALVLPLLVILLFGIVQFGIAYNHSISLTDAVRAGARAAAIAGPDNATAAATQAVTKAAGGLTITNVQVRASGSDVVVTATYPYSITLLGVVVKAGSLTSTSTEAFE